MDTKRRICWPEPDSVCLEGGCLYCNDNPFRAVSTIRRYAEKVGLVEPYDYGESHYWNQAETK